MKTKVAQVTVLDGREYQEAGNTLVEDTPSRQVRERGSLYVLIQPGERRRAGDPDQVPDGRIAEDSGGAAKLADVVRRVYYGWRGSVTAGLQEAVREANRELFEENRTSLPGERRTAGITCAVLRGSDLFLVQAGPAVAFALHEGQVIRFPELSPWIDNIPLEDMDAAALGDRAEARTVLFHLPVSPGDALILTETTVASCTTAPAWKTILNWASAGPEAMLDALVDIAQGCNYSALALALTDSGAGLRPAAGPVVGARPRATAVEPGLFTDEPDMEVTAEEIPLVPGGRLRVGVGVAAARLGNALFAALSALWAGLRPVLAAAGGGLLALLRRMVPSQPLAEMPPSVQSSRAAPRRATRHTTRETARRPAARPPVQVARRDGAAGDPVQKALTVLAIAIPLVVAAIVVGIVLQRGQARRTELDAFWAQAQQSWTEGQVPDPAAARPRLLAAQAVLDELLARDPQRKEAKDLRDKVLVRLDDINKVRRIRWVGRLNTYAGDPELRRVVVQGMHVFVLDRKEGRVYHHQLDTSQQALTESSKDTVLVSRGQQVGRVSVGDLIDMAWMPVDVDNVRQRPALVILESNGNVLDYDPSTRELNALPVAAHENWKYPQLVGSHTGRFYVLDTSANKIWRYPPAADGYTTAPDDWLQGSLNLNGTVDMVVGDGIYLLSADSQITKLAMGVAAPFSVADWDVPPKAPGALSGYPDDETEWIFLADAGNARIVQCDPEGKFTRQYRLADPPEGTLDPLAGVTSLWVDESVKRAYFTSGNGLYLVILPE